MQSYAFTQINAVILEKFYGMRLLYRSVLRVFGLRHIADYSDFDAAYQYVQMAAPDIAFVDWSAGFDGLEFVHRLRSEESKNRLIPIVVISAFTTPTEVAIARDAGVNEFLAKPVSAALMYERICAVIENSRPFVREEAYFGPDRRRHKIPYDGEEKRAADEEAA